MKQIKPTFLLSLLLSTASTPGLAASPVDNLYVYTKQANIPTVYSLDELDKITFDANGISFWNTKWPTTYAYSNFGRISLNPSSTPTGIEQTTVGDEGVAITYDRHREVVVVQSGTPLSRVSVCDMHGRLITSANGEANALTVPLQRVPRGIYLVRVDSAGGSVSKKIVK